MGGMILPKGIVTNTSWIYEEVAKYPVVPPDQIHKYWRVYTTTFTRLVDPTANRLENFWWHVWGSELRNLPGPVLARLFEEISNGPTFVKLRSTANRYEGPSQPSSPNANRVVDPDRHDENNSTIAHEGVQSPLSPELDAPADLAVARKSSAMQQPPGKPILKTPRAPSSTGPRPVARFVSPAVSDSEDLASSSSTAVNEQANARDADLLKAKVADKKRVGSVTPKKKGAKVVASTAARRRPAMPRRPSSQSSAGGSDNGSKESGSVSSKISSSARSIETIEEGKRTPAAHRPGTDVKIISAKSVGKRPATSVNHDHANTLEPAKTQTPPSSNLTSAGLQTSQHQMANSVPTTTSEPPTTNPQPSPRARNSSYEGQGTTNGRPSFPAGAAMSRSRSDMGTSRPGMRDWNMNRRGFSQGLLSGTTVTTSNATAQGTIIEFDENIPASLASLHNFGTEDDPIQGLQRSGTGSSTSSRLVPTLPSGSPNVHLGRSKSQLTLLLERQGDDKRSRR